MSNKYEVGCYADGAAGHQRCREHLAGLLADEAVQGSEEVITSLRGEMPDDAWDEDKALDMLNDATENVRPSDTLWQFADGDLMLSYTDDRAARNEAATRVIRARNELFSAQRTLCSDDDQPENRELCAEAESVVNNLAGMLLNTSPVEKITVQLSEKQLETVLTALIIAQDATAGAIERAKGDSFDLRSFMQNARQFAQLLETRAKWVDEHNTRTKKS